MRSLVRAEVLKLRTTRMPAGLLIATLGLVALTVVVNIPSPGVSNVRVPLDHPELLARVVGVSLGVPEVLMLLLGVLVVTQEFRYGTASSTFLVTPRRRSVLVAKAVGTILVSVPVVVTTLVVSLAVAIPLIRSRGGSLTANAELWQVVAAAFAVSAALGVVGVAIGALVRNQIAGVVGVLVWMLVVEQILSSAYVAVGRWTPGGATFGLLQIGPVVTTKGDFLPAPMAGLVLLAYVVAACVTAAFVAPRRDVG